LNDWQLDESAKEISRSFAFKNYYQTIAFVNALAWIAHQEDHHPDLQVGYNRVQVRFSTHSIGGLSQNDFICAAKIDALSN
jgi:4a-hydroxytetrahydrobiopterin dehydratase